MLDTNSNTILNTIVHSDYCHSLAIHPDGSRLYAASADRVEAIDTVTNAITKTLTISAYDSSMDVHPDGSRLYITSGLDKNMSVVDTASLTLIATIPIGGWPKAYGNFVGYISESIAGKITQDGVGQADVKVTIANAGGSATVVTDASGNYLTAVAKGTYTVTPGKAGYTFVPEQRDVTIGEQSVAQIDFTANVHAPTVTISAQPSTVWQGQSTTITWSSTNATSAVLDNGVDNIAYGLNESRSYLIFKTTTFTITATGPGGTASASVVVNFDSSTTPKVTIAANPATIKPGESSKLIWQSYFANTAQIDNNIGSVPLDGFKAVTPTATTTYKITVTGNSGSATAQVTVIVIGTTPTVSISASPATIQAGGSATLTWTSTNATSASIDNGIGTVPVNGSITVTPAATTTYKITVTGPGGSNTVQVTVTVVPYDTSAILTGTVSDLASSQPIAGVAVSAVDVSGVPKTAVTDAAGKYVITNLRVGSITVSFAKSGYDPYQQTINIPANTTIDLTTQLHLTQVGATLHGLVKDGQTSQPIVGATVTATFATGSLTSTSGSDGAYALAGIPLNTPVIITASATDYRDVVINQTFTQSASLVYNFVLYSTSAVATINGTILNSKTMQPEAGVSVSHQETGVKTISDASGKFILTGIPFGQGTFNFLKDGFINKFFTKDIDQSTYQWDVFEPLIIGKEIKVAANFSGIILDSFTQQPITGALVQVIGRPIQGMTDANGRFSLSGIDLGSCNISVTAVRYSAFEVHALIDNTNPTTHDFSLNPICLGTVKGKITDSNGVAINGVRIDLSAGGIISAQTGYSGEYELAVFPVGTHTIEFFHPCYEKITQTVTINHEGESQNLNVSLVKRPAQGKLTGRIINKSSKAGIANASVSIAGTSVNTLTDATGGFSFATAPLGLIKLNVEAAGYLTSNCERYVEVLWDDPSSATVAKDIELEQTSSANSMAALAQAEEPISVLVEAAKGGIVSSPDGRLELLIAPNMLPVDLRFSIALETEASVLNNGDLIPVQQSEQPEEAYALGKTIRLSVSAAIEGNPVPDFQIPVVLLSRYGQDEVEAFGGAEETAGFYFNTGSAWKSVDIVPNQHFVDPYNNMVGSLIILDSQQSTPQTSTFSAQTSALAADPIFEIFKIVSGVRLLTNLLQDPPPMVKIYDKDQLSAVTSALPENIPNPNALPLLVFNGNVPNVKWLVKPPDPNVDPRYSQILQDLVKFSNGVYRPVFVAYNTAAHIDGNAELAVQLLHPDGPGKFIKFKGIPAHPGSQTSGQFSYVDTFGYSMGGLVARYYTHYTGCYVNNMLMLATPNHGTLAPVLDIMGKLGKPGLIRFVKLMNSGVGDLLDYPDDDFDMNPKLAFLNNSGFPPRGDISLWAGTDQTAYSPLGIILRGYYDGYNDSVVPVTSVFYQPSPNPTFPYTHPFTHQNVGTSDYPIRNFEEEVRRGLSDWEVEKAWESTSTPEVDNYRQMPTATKDGVVRAMVTLEYNVWDGYQNRAKRDIDRVVLVIYYKDALGDWHIAKSNTNQNGADPEGNVNDDVDFPLVKSSKSEPDPDKKKISAIAILEANPDFNQPGYEASKDVKEIQVIVVTLKPDDKTVPKDPLAANFAVPY